MNHISRGTLYTVPYQVYILLGKGNSNNKVYCSTHLQNNHSMFIIMYKITTDKCNQKAQR